MAVVESEAMLKATASGPYRSAIRRIAVAVRLKRLVPLDPLPPGIPIALRPGSLKWMCQPIGVIHQFGRGPTLRAKRLAGWVRGIRLQSDKAAILAQPRRSRSGRCTVRNSPESALCCFEQPWRRAPSLWPITKRDELMKGCFFARTLRTAVNISKIQSICARGDAAYSPFMAAPLMIGHHFSISALCNRPSASGVC